MSGLINDTQQSPLNAKTTIDTTSALTNLLNNKLSQQQPQSQPQPQQSFQSSLPSTSATANTYGFVPPQQYFQQQQLQKSMMNMTLQPNTNANTNNIQSPVKESKPTSDDSKNKTQGKVKWFSGRKGYGFITLNDGSGDVFVHHSQCYCQGYRSLADGEIVEFDVELQSDGRRKAKNVTGLNGSYCVGGQPPSTQTNEDYGRGGYQRSYGRRGRGRGGGGGGRFNDRRGGYGGYGYNSGSYPQQSSGSYSQTGNSGSYGSQGGSQGSSRGGYQQYPQRSFQNYSSGAYYNNSSNSNYQVRGRRSGNYESGSGAMYNVPFQRMPVSGSGRGFGTDVNSNMMQFVPMATAAVPNALPMGVNVGVVGVNAVNAVPVGNVNVLAFDQSNQMSRVQSGIQASPPILTNVQQYQQLMQ